MQDSQKQTVTNLTGSKPGSAPENGVGSFGQPKDVMESVDGVALHTDFIGKAVLFKPFLQTPRVAAARASEESVDGAGLVANTYPKSRPTLHEGMERFRISDVDLFNQCCIEFGWLELRVQGGSDYVGTDAFVKSFHEQFAKVLRRDPLEILQILRKYAVTGGFDGIPAPEGWLKKVEQYIAARTAQPRGDFTLMALAASSAKNRPICRTAAKAGTAEVSA